MIEDDDSFIKARSDAFENIEWIVYEPKIDCTAYWIKKWRIWIIISHKNYNIYYLSNIILVYRPCICVTVLIKIN